MGFFKKKNTEKMEEQIKSYFKMINGYIPTFSTFEGSIYEMELTRAAIHCFATHCSKLKPEVLGSGNEILNRTLQFKPNPLMDTKKYLYRLATVLMTDNTAMIAPLYDDYLNIVGFYPLLTSKCRIVSYEGKKYVRYDFGNGQHGCCELENMGIINQFQYKNELFGESNSCLTPTLDLIKTQNQGIIEGIKNAASIRFMGQLGSVLKSKDIKEEQKRFRENNLGVENNGGILMFDQKYSNVQQINSTPYVINAAQMSQIKENVFNYFGTNENILQNKASSSEWNAYYEGKIEPFALEASLVHTNMLFNMREIAYGNEVMFTSNRMQFMSPEEKANINQILFDRGQLTINQGLEIFNLPPVEDGDKRYIRKEYCEVSQLGKVESENE